jgi:peptide alpha-N-acetyltransferase
LASQLLEQARGMDLADRYLNTKSVRFLMRADKIKEAENTISPFTKLVCSSFHFRLFFSFFE